MFKYLSPQIVRQLKTNHIPTYTISYITELSEGPGSALPLIVGGAVGGVAAAAVVAVIVVFLVRRKQRSNKGSSIFFYIYIQYKQFVVSLKVS